MGTTTDVLNVKLTADDSGFSAKMRSASKQAEDFGKASQEAAAKASAGFKDLKSALVGLGIGQVIKTSITDAMNAVESENLFETSLGGLSKQARAWSEELSSSLGLDGYALRKNLGTLYNMTTSMGLAKDSAYEMSTSLVQLSEDFASFYNLSSDEAFSKIRSALTGEMEPLKSLGFVLDENTLKQEAYAMGIAKAGEELTQQQKIYATYSALLKQSANAQGDLARTIDSPSNQMRIMMNDLKMASIEFGTALMPIVKTALPIFRDVIADVAPIAVDMANGVSLLSSGLGMLENPSIRAIAYTVAIAGAMNKLKLAVGGPLSAILLLGSALTWLVGKFGETEQSTAEVIDTTMTDAAAETDKVGKSADEMGEKYKRAGDMVKSMLAPFDDVNKLSGSGSTLGSSLVSQEDVENATALNEELDKLGNQSYTVDVTVPEIKVPEIGLPTDIDWSVIGTNLRAWSERHDWQKDFIGVSNAFVELFGVSLDLVDGILGTHFSDWYDKVVNFFMEYGAELAKATNPADEGLLALEQYEKEHGNSAWFDFYEKYKSGVDAETAFSEVYSTPNLKKGFLAANANLAAYHVSEWEGMTSLELAKILNPKKQAEDMYAHALRTNSGLAGGFKSLIYDAFADFRSFEETHDVVAMDNINIPQLKTPVSQRNNLQYALETAYTANPSTFEKSISTRDLYTLFGNSGAGASPIQIISRIELDGQVLGESVTNYQNDQTQATNGRQ